jgi:hypothetical protein
MDWFYRGGSWLFGWLALALLVLGSLVVPDQFAFADSGTCSGACSQFTQGSPQYNTCVAQCQMCLVSCMATYGGQGSGYENCVAGCYNDTFSGACSDSSCPNPTFGNCHIDDGENMQTACAGICCENASNACTCSFDNNTNLCNCPD